MDHQRWFHDIFVVVLGFVNDAWVLWFSFLYHWAIDGNLFIIDRGEEGIQPYILGDKRYPPLALVDGAPQANWGAAYCSWSSIQSINVSWHKCGGELFWDLEKKFQELILKINLHVHFLPNVVVCCCMLRNLILNGKMRI